jgi:Protein of unknown function (DUF3176)
MADEFRTSTRDEARAREAVPAWRKKSVAIPWLNILLVILYLICIAAVVITICMFHQKTVVNRNPERQPSSILAVIVSLSNFSLATLLAAGIANAWWFSAKRGTTLHRLHLIWEHGVGRGVFAALQAGWDSRMVAIGSVLVAVVHFASDPLVQRGISTTNGQIHEDFTMNLNVPQTLPDYWTGTRQIDANGGRSGAILGSPAGIQALRGWFRNTTMYSTYTLGDTESTTGYICPANSTCTAIVPGPGIGYDCFTSSSPFNLTDPNNYNTTTFSIDLGVNNASYGTNQTFLTLNSSYLADVSDSCLGTLYVETCTIWSATVAYPIVLTSDVITFNLAETELPPVMSNYTSPGDLLSSAAFSGAGMLLGIDHFLRQVMITDSRLTGPSAASSSTWIGVLFTTPNLTRSQCELQYIQPAPYVLGAIKSFVARLAFNSGNSTNRQSLAAQQIINAALYKRDNGFLAAAVVVMAVGLLAALTLFWGFWEVGPDRSLSPIETGKSFGAPLLSHATTDPTEPVERLLDRIGTVPVAHDESGRIVRTDRIPLTESAVRSPLLERMGSDIEKLQEPLPAPKPAFAEDIAPIGRERSSSRTSRTSRFAEINVDSD